MPTSTKLLDYCRRSANPVGNLLLHLYEEATPVNLAYSDAICTALQLINFWQDVAKDYAIGRIYLPLDDMARFGVSEEQIAEGRADATWRALMKFEVDRARALMLQGAPLGSILTGRIGLEMRMIIAGGLRILDQAGSCQLRHVQQASGIAPVRLGYHAGEKRTVLTIMTPINTAKTRPPPAAPASTTAFASCPETSAAPSPRCMPSAARWTMWWMNAPMPMWHAPRSTGGAMKLPPSMAASRSIPLRQALVPVVKQFNLAQEHLLEIIDGMEMDLDQTRYADFKSLQLYCYRVASVVGLLSVEIFGYTDRQTLKYAHDLGIAFQLTNIIRDVGEDARRNRIYLPMDELQQFGVTAADILNVRETENFQKLMAFQIERAQRYYQQALDHLPAVDRKAQRTGLIMAAIYRATLDEVIASGCHVLKERVSLTRQAWLL